MTEEQATQLLDLLGKLYLAARLVLAAGFLQVGLLVWLSYSVARRP